VVIASGLSSERPVFEPRLNFLVIFGDSLFQNYWFCVIKSSTTSVPHFTFAFSASISSEPRTWEYWKESSIAWAELTMVCERIFKNMYYIPMQFWPFYYKWKWMKSKEHDQTCVPKPLPAEVKRWRLQEWFSNISVQVKFYWYQYTVC